MRATKQMFTGDETMSLKKRCAKAVFIGILVCNFLLSEEQFIIYVLKIEIKLKVTFIKIPHVD